MPKKLSKAQQKAMRMKASLAAKRAKAKSGATTSSKAIQFDPDLNDDTCFVCGNGGVLVLCDQCTLAFHLRCTIPKLNTPPSSEEPFYCVVCKAKRSGDNIPRKDRYAAQEDYKKIMMIKNRCSDMKKAGVLFPDVEKIVKSVEAELNNVPNKLKSSSVPLHKGEDKSGVGFDTVVDNGGECVNVGGIEEVVEDNDVVVGDELIGKKAPFESRVKQQHSPLILSSLTVGRPFMMKCGYRPDKGNLI